MIDSVSHDTQACSEATKSDTDISQK